MRVRQLNLFEQTQDEARDAALNLLEDKRAELIACAMQIAQEIAQQLGTVTSPAVLVRLQAECPEAVAGVDRRFMGAVFRRSRGWTRVGWAAQGSHSRPVSVWKLTDE
jgi:hypothetical protein